MKLEIVNIAKWRPADYVSVLLTLFWAIKALEHVLSDGPSRAFAAAVLPGSSQWLKGLMANGLAVVYFGLSLIPVFWPRRPWPHLIGASAAGIMLAGVILLMPGHYGAPCGCLSIFGVDEFGRANVLIIGSIVLGYLGCAREYERRATQVG